METLFGAAVLAVLAWWWLGSAGSDLPVVGPVVHRLHLGSARAAKTTAAAASVGSRTTQSAPAASDSDRQWRKAKAEEYAKLMAQRDAVYNTAQAAYDRQREVIGSRITALEESNKRGCNDAEIEALIAQRSSLSLPQR